VSITGSRDGGGEFLLYAYFPPGWRTRRTFYTFSFVDVWKVDPMFGAEAWGVSHDISALEPLIASFTMR
jgi:hypothetical protein